MRLPAAVRGACGRPSTQAALGNFFLRAGAKLAVNDGKKFSNFSRRAKIEASTRHVSFSALSTPPAVQGRVKKLYFIKSTIYARWCAHNLNAAVERRRAARQPLIPYRPAPVFGSSENRREVSRSAPVRDRVGNEWVRDAVGEWRTLFTKSSVCVGPNAKRQKGPPFTLGPPDGSKSRFYGIGILAVAALPAGRFR